MSTVPLALLKAVFVDGSTPIRARPAAQPLALAQFTAGHIYVECVNQDGTPHSLAYDTLLLGVRLHPTDGAPAISLQASNMDTDPDGNVVDNWARFELVPGHWPGVPPRIYGYDVVAYPGGDPNDAFPVVPASQWRTTDENFHPGDNVQVPPSQQPLKRGPESEIRLRHTLTLADVNSLMSDNGFPIVFADDGIPDAEDSLYGLSYDLISGSGYPSFRGTARTTAGFFLNVSGDLVEGDVVEVGRKPGASDPSRGPAGPTGATGATGAAGAAGASGVPFTTGTDASRPPTSVGSFRNTDEGSAIFTWDGAKWVMADGRPSLYDQVLATENANLVFFWQLNDVSGTAADSSGLGHTGRYTASAHGIPSVIRRTTKTAAAGSGSSGKVASFSPSTFPFSSATGFSLHIGGFCLASLGSDLQFFLTSAFGITIASADGSASFNPDSTLLAPAGTFASGGYYSVSITYDGAGVTNTLNLWVNGIKTGSVNPITPISSDGGATFKFDMLATMQMIAGWTIGLTSTEVANLFLAGGRP